MPSFACQRGAIAEPFKTVEDDFVTIGHGFTDTSSFHSAVINAANQWSRVSSKFDVNHSSYDNTSVGGSLPDDGQNTVWISDDWRRDVTAAAETSAWYSPSALEEGFTDCDIKVYAKYGAGTSHVNFEFDLDDNPTALEVSFTTVMAHEFGHCAGIMDKSIAGSVMNGEVTKGEVRQVNNPGNDADAIIFLYGS